MDNNEKMIHDHAAMCARDRIKALLFLSGSLIFLEPILVAFTPSGHGGNLLLFSLLLNLYSFFASLKALDLEGKVFALSLQKNQIESKLAKSIRSVFIPVFPNLSCHINCLLDYWFRLVALSLPKKSVSQ